MKEFKFEITLIEGDLSGDEFWENALERDGTGVADLTDYLTQIIIESNLLACCSDKEVKNTIKLISYKNK